MRLWLRTLAFLAVLAAIGLGVWWYVNRERLAWQWSCYRVGAAGSFDEAQAEIARLETGPRSRAGIRELVGKWGTGNQRFDLYLARYLYQPNCTAALRESFCGELGCRPELLPRWAHCWSHLTELEPDQRIGSICGYLDTRKWWQGITWREVLDLQAVFQLTGQGQFAERLTPDNWHDRYRRWQQVRPSELPHVARPKRPVPD